MSILKRKSTIPYGKQEIAFTYQKAFDKLDIKYQEIKENYFNAFHLFVIELEERLGLYNYLRDNGIYIQIHYIPVHLKPYYQQLGWTKGDFPISEKYYNHFISITMYPTLKLEELQYVIQKVREFCNG